LTHIKPKETFMTTTHPIKVSDYFQGLEVTKVSDNFCFFGNKRLSWNTVIKLIKSGASVQYALSPNKSIDWTNKDDVVSYHNSFKYWNTYISGWSSRFEIYSGILEVKNGLVLYEQEYYLPSPVAKFIDGHYMWHTKQENIEDGKYNITLLKQENDWYPRVDANRGNIILNLFRLGTKVKSSIKELKANSNELWASQYGDGINFSYEHSTWNGLSFSLTSLNVIKLFRKYFVEQRWSTDHSIELTDAEIGSIMYPIYDEISDIVTNALHNREFNISVENSWGDVIVDKQLQFNENIANSVFSLIETQLQT